VQPAATPEPVDAAESLWRDRIIAAAHKAVDDLRADNAFEHRVLIEELEELIRRVTDGDVRPP